MGYIYKISNSNNDKLYIGQTKCKDPRNRWYKHRYTARHLERDREVSVLHRAMAKYGLNTFKFEIIEEITNELLDEREQYWIKFYNSVIPNGYNITQGGAGTKGYSRPQTENEKEKRRQSNKEFYKTHPEAVEERRQYTTELWKNEEYRKRVTESNIKFYSEHPDMFKGENNPFYGKHHTDETKAKIKESSLHRYKPIEKLDKDTEEVLQIYDGVKEAEKDLGVSHGWISKAAKQNKIAYGYKWRFVESVTTN